VPGFNIAKHKVKIAYFFPDPEPRWQNVCCSQLVVTLLGTNFTKKLLGLRSLPYNERLSLLLGLERLELQRIRGDLLMCYKIIYGLVYIPFDAFSKFSTSSTRGHWPSA